MICPRCKTGRIDRVTGKCAECQYEPPAFQENDLPAGDEIERQIDKLLGREYQIEGLVGRGGMSLVYLAREMELNRLVALKILPFLLSMGSGTHERFSREAKIAASLEHPNIVPVYRVGTASSFMWYAMKYIKGQSLAQIVDQRGPMELEVLLEVLGQIGSAIEYAHRRGVVHRDIKPENVLVDGHGWVWVCDFGVAKAFGSIPLTQTGGTLGTPSYMSPEQCYGEQLDGRADQYALAIMVYRCLAGVLPFEADSVGEMIRKQCMDPPPRLSRVRSDLPPAVTTALLRAMAKKRDDRFGTVAEFIEALGGRIAPSAARESLGAAAQTVPDQETTAMIKAARRPFPVRRVATVTVAAGLIAAGAFLIPRLDQLLPKPADGAVRLDSTRVITAPPAAEPEVTTAQDPARIDTARSQPVAPANAILDVTTSDPGWGNLFVNGRLVGTTPMRAVSVPAGTVHVRITQDGYRALDTTLTVAPGELRQLLQLRLVRVSGVEGS